MNYLVYANKKGTTSVDVTNKGYFIQKSQSGSRSWWFLPISVKCHSITIGIVEQQGNLFWLLWLNCGEKIAFWRKKMIY